MIFVVFYLSSNAADVGSNFWLSSWSDETKNATLAEQKKFYRLGIYALLGFLQCLFTLFANLSFMIMLLKATKLMHNRMLHSVLRAPLRFFESTPTGRILNRFTTDIKATEDSIPSSIKSIFSMSLSLISVIVVITRSTPLFLIAFVPILCLYLYIQRYFVPSSRQIKRMQTTTQSPIFSHFTESQNGVTTIKAFNCQSHFIDLMQEKIDHNFRNTFAQSVANRWLGLRLEAIGNLITIFAAFFAILSRTSLSSGLAGKKRSELDFFLFVFCFASFQKILNFVLFINLLGMSISISMTVSFR